MFANIRAQRRRLTVSLAHSRRVGTKVLCDHVAYLGSVALPEPISLAERGRFWDQADARLAALSISPADAAKVRATIAGRIPPLATEDELRRHRTAAALNDVVTAVRQFGGNETLADAIVRLAELAREIQDQTKLKEPA